MKVLVVGAGAYVSGRGTDGLGTVLPALVQLSKRLPVSDVVICATDRANGPRVARAAAEANAKLGAQLAVRYADAAATLADARAFDCAIVVVPDHLHAAIGAQVLQQGLHCLMVKPFAPTVAEARQLIALQTQHDLHGVVEFHKRLDPQNRIVKRLIAEQRIGRLSHATIHYSQRIEVPADLFRSWSSQTNIFQYLGVHYVDLFFFLTGFRPLRAMAVGCRGVLAQKGVDTPDAVVATIVWCHPEDNNHEFVSSFTVGWIDSAQSTAMSDQRYEVIGGTGRIACDQKDRGLNLVSDEQGVRTINPHFSEYLSDAQGQVEFAGYGADSIAQFVADIAQIRAGRRTTADLAGCRPTFAQALVSTAVIEAVNKSLAADGAWKTIDANV